MCLGHRAVALENLALRQPLVALTRTSKRPPLRRTLDGPLETAPPGPPEYCCRDSLTRGPDGYRESAVGSASNPRRIVQSGRRGLGADRVAVAPEPGSSALPDVANVPHQSRRSHGLDGLLHGPDPDRPCPVRLRAARAPTPTSRPPRPLGTRQTRRRGLASGRGRRPLVGRCSGRLTVDRDDPHARFEMDDLFIAEWITAARTEGLASPTLQRLCNAILNFARTP